MRDPNDWETIIYYKRWAETLIGMPEELRHKIHDAIDEYIVNRTLPTDERILYSVFSSIKRDIDNDKKKYNDKIVVRNQENGKRGGRPRKTQITQKTQWDLKNPKKLDIDIDNDNNNNSLSHTLSPFVENESDNLSERESDLKFDSQKIKQELLSAQMWKEGFCTSFMLPVSFMSLFPEKIDKFIAYIVSVGEEETISNLSDAKRRFTYWWRDHGSKEEIKNETERQVYIIPD